MNRGQLSRRERKARIRFIQCHHYNRREQQFVDEYIYYNRLSYVELWKGHKAGRFFMVETIIGCNRVSRAMAAVGISAEATVSAFARLGDCMREAEKEEFI
jgi:hypothetical protein